ncbi:hypothetical protein ACOSP7_030567 [Xanthoceras sorbifolium]
MVTIREVIEEEQLHSNKQYSNKEEENPDGDGDDDLDLITRMWPKKRRKKLRVMTNDVYIQIRILRGVLGYYQQNNLYPHDNPNSLQEFLQNWLEAIFMADDFREIIDKLRCKFRSEKPDVPEKKLNLESGKKKQSIDNVDDNIEILACMIDYCISKGRYPFPQHKCYEDFYTKWLSSSSSSKLSRSECWLTICRSKTKYEEWVKKKGQGLVFSGIDELLLFNLSEIIWGSEGELSEEEIDMKTLAAVIDYYNSKCKYPFEETKYKEDFYQNWINYTIIPFQSCFGKIGRIKEDYIDREKKREEGLVFSGVDKLLVFKLSKFIWGSRNVDVDKKILRAMVDYYTSEGKYPLDKHKYLEDFHKSLKMEITLRQCLATIQRLKRKYENQAKKKKGKALVFSGGDDQELFDLSDTLWGSENAEEEDDDHGDTYDDVTSAYRG